MFNVLLGSISNKIKVYIDDVSNIIKISNWIFSFWNCSTHRRCNIFYRYDGYNTFSDDFGIIPIRFKLFLVIILLFFKRLVIGFCGFDIVNEILFFSRMLLFNETIQKFTLIDIDFFKPFAIHGFEQILNFYFLIFLRGQ